MSQVDAAVVCFGTRMQASILATLHLKELGIKNIFAKATSEEHGRILKKVEASEIFFLEEDLARIFHDSLAATTDMAVLPGVLGCQPL